MSFTGDLEHLPIVDVIQLLHATRKSGILRVSCHKGESQLVFKDGFIVSANNLNNKVRIGKILIDLGLITPDLLDKALQEQENAGNNRKPLVITLIEMGLVKESDAYKGLEQLIEMTVVEILTWKGGTFTLDVMPQSVDDEYRYFPEKMSREINVDTQGILMNALRIFDEKKRDGQLEEDDSTEIEFDLLPSPEKEEEPILSAEDLGLDDIDQLEKKLPQVYSVLEDKSPEDIHLQEVEKLAPHLSMEEIKALVSFLGEFTSPQDEDDTPAKSDRTKKNLLFYSCDDLFSYCLTVVCRDAGISVFATSEEEALDHLLARLNSVGNLTLLVLDSPDNDKEGFSSEKVSMLRARKKEDFRQLRMLQFAPADEAAFVTQAYDDNARAVFPKPSRKGGGEGNVADTIRLLKTFHGYIRSYVAESEFSNTERLNSVFSELQGVSGAPDAAFVLLKFVADIFERSVTLVVREKEMVAEKGIGIKAGKETGVIPSMGFRIPLTRPSLLNEVIERGKPYFGHVDDAVFEECLFARIGTPEKKSVILLPLRYQGKTISLTYGDFGDKEPTAVDIGTLDLLVKHAELSLENAMYRKRIEKSVAKG